MIAKEARKANFKIADLERIEEVLKERRDELKHEKDS